MLSITRVLWTVALLQTVLSQGTDCPSLGITYTSQLSEYNASTLLHCSTMPNYRWWKSTSPCGRFTSITDQACSTSVCLVEVVAQSIQRNFYYCCTEGDVNVIESGTPKTCFHIDICARVISSRASSAPSVAFFGHTLPIYVELYGEPPPMPNEPSIHLRYGDTQNDLLSSNLTTSQYVYPSVDSPLIVWVFEVKVPVIEFVQNGELSFTVGFGSVDPEMCTSVRSITYNSISVVRSTVAEPTEMPTTTLTVLPTDVQAALSVVCLQWYILFAIFLTTTLVLSAVLAGLCVYISRIKSKSDGLQSLSHLSTTNTHLQRPGSLSYNLLRQSSSVTPTPVGSTARSMEYHQQFEPVREAQVGAAEKDQLSPQATNTDGHYEDIPGAIITSDNAQDIESYAHNYPTDYINNVGNLPKQEKEPHSTDV